MNALHAVWLSSIIAVILLPAAGFLLGLFFARRKEAPALSFNQATPALPTGAEVKELATLRDELAAIKNELSTAQSRETKLADKAATLEKEKQSLQGQAEQLRAQAEQAIRDRDQAILLRTTEDAVEDEATQVQAGPEQVQLDAMDKELQHTKQSLTQAERERDAQQERVMELQKQIHQFQTQKLSWQSRINELQKKVEQGQKGTPSGAKTLLGMSSPLQPDQENEITALKELLEARQRELETGLQTETKLREQLKAVQAENKKLQTSGGSPPAAAAGAQPQKLQAADTAQKREIQELKSQLAPIKSKLERSEEERAKLKLHIEELGKDLAKAKSLEKVAEEKHDLVLRVEALKQKEQEAETLRDEKAQLVQRLKEAETRLSKLKELENVTKERHDLAIKVQVLSNQLEELERLRAEKFEMADRLKDAEHKADQAKDLETVAKERQDLAIKVQLQDKQLEELERLRVDNVTMKQSMSEVNHLRQQLEVLTAENATLRSKGLVIEKPKALAVDAQAAEGVGGSLQSILSKLAQTSDTRGAVLADEMGLLVAGVGNHTEALAALAALMSDTGERAKVLLPFAALRNLTLVDQNSLTVTAQPLATQVGQLILATLTVGPGPEHQEMEAILGSAKTELS